MNTDCDVCRYGRRRENGDMFCNIVNTFIPEVNMELECQRFEPRYSEGENLKGAENV
jgi:hypothetical protein